jgi:hypothetical protein
MSNVLVIAFLNECLSLEVHSGLEGRRLRTL